MKKIIGIIFTVVLLFVSTGGISARWDLIDDTDRSKGSFSYSPGAYSNGTPSPWTYGESWTGSYYWSHTYTPAYVGREAMWTYTTTEKASVYQNAQIYINHPNFKAEVEYTFFCSNGKGGYNTVDRIYLNQKNAPPRLAIIPAISNNWNGNIGKAINSVNPNSYHYGVKMTCPYKQHHLLMGADAVY